MRKRINRAGPWVEDRRTYCVSCDHIWDAPVLRGVSDRVWRAYRDSMQCPRCGADHTQLGCVTDEATLMQKLADAKREIKEKKTA